MKLTKKTVKQEVESTETVCEIAKDEFEMICAQTAAKTIANFVGEDPEVADIVVGVHLTSLFADFAARLIVKLFDNDKTENPDKNEKEEK